MKIIAIAGVLLAALAVGATAGLMPKPVPMLDGAPARAYTVLGPVAVVSAERPDARPWSLHHGRTLVAEARTLYNRRPDALAAVSHEALPGGSGVRSSALAISWDN